MKADSKEWVLLSVKVPLDLRAGIDAEARTECLSRSDVVRRALIRDFRPATAVQSERAA